MKINSLYLMGSLRNPKVPELANKIEDVTGIEVFDSWHAPGPEADDHWRAYEKARGRTYEQALRHHAARNVFEFDKHNIDKSDGCILYMPAGKSAHMELGYVIGTGKPGFILFDEEPERWDVMYQFATRLFFNVDDFLITLGREYR